MNPHATLLVFVFLSSVVSHTPDAAAVSTEVRERTPDGLRLSIGDPSPALLASRWLRGEPVVRFEPGHVYVVEFWASWCVPCIAGMPHLSELQNRHRGEATIIGMNIWEDPDVAAAWVGERGDELMNYSVAIQLGEEMETRWMDAAGQDGIPAAFIIDGAGAVAWIGHPNDLDQPLQRVIDGGWDIEAFRASYESAAARADRERAAMAEFEAAAKDEIATYTAAVDANDIDAIARAATALIALRPPGQVARNLFGGTVHRMVTGGRAKLAGSFMRTNLRAIEDDPEQLVQFGRALVSDDLFAGARDAGLAIVMLTRASEIKEHADPAVLELVARAHMLRAIQLQRTAVDRAADASKDAMRVRLEAYEQAVRSPHVSPQG